MNYGISADQQSVPAGTDKTILGKSSFEYKLIEETAYQQFQLYVSTKKMSVNQTAAGKLITFAMR